MPLLIVPILIILAVVAFLVQPYRLGVARQRARGWLGLVVTGRILFGFWRAWHAWPPGVDHASWAAAAGLAKSMAAGGVVLGYYFVYWIDVRPRLRSRRASRNTPSNDSASIDPSILTSEILQAPMAPVRAVIAIPQRTGPLLSRHLAAIDSVRRVHRRPTMVDSPQERAMTNGSSDLPERVEVIEQKLDGLIQSVDARFDQVDAAIIEQRAYTEFAYEKLDSKMDAGFAGLGSKMDARIVTLDSKMDAGFARLDRKMDTGFARLDSKIDTGLAGLETKMDAGFVRADSKMDAGFARLDSKIDGGLAGLETRMNAGLTTLDSKVAGLDSKVAGLDSKVAGLDSKVAGLDQKIDDIDNRLGKVDGRIARLETKIDDIDDRLGKVDGRFARIEGKIDQIIDLHVPKTPPDVSTSE